MRLKLASLLRNLADRLDPRDYHTVSVTTGNHDLVFTDAVLACEVVHDEPLPVPPGVDPLRVDVAARALAKEEGKFISAVDWGGKEGERYRVLALDMIELDSYTFEVAEALRKYDSGVQSGGL